MSGTERTGSVETTSSGRHRVRVRPYKGAKLKTVGTFDSHREAVRFRASLVDVLPTSEGTGDRCLGEYGAIVLRQRELAEEGDVTNDQSRWNNHVVGDDLAKLSIRHLEKVHVEQWLKRLKAKGLGRQMRIHCQNTLRAVWNTAQQEYKLKTSCPCTVKIPKDKVTHKPWTFLSPDEQRRLIKATPKPLDAIVEFAIGSGLRAGELISLRVDDVVLGGPDPHIMVRYGGRPNAKWPKGRPTKGGEPRKVELFGHALAALKRWMPQLKFFAPDNPYNLVFPGPNGAYRQKSHVLRWGLWKGAPARPAKGRRKAVPAVQGIVQQAGISRNVRWHDLRHTFASSLLSGYWGRAWRLEEVQALLGHADIETTQRYAHLADSARRKAAHEARSLFQAVPSSNGAAADSSMISVERDTRLEPVTSSLGSWRKAPVVSLGSTTIGTVVEQVFLAAAKEDRAALRAASIDLAREVASSRAVMLASQVLAGGPHASARAIELAKVLSGRFEETDDAQVAS